MTNCVGLVVALELGGVGIHVLRISSLDSVDVVGVWFVSTAMSICSGADKHDFARLCGDWGIVLVNEMNYRL